MRPRANRRLPAASRAATTGATKYLLEQLKQAACRLESETFALYLAARDPRTPWYAKLLVAGVVAYAFSPIDLIPDFIPILGYLDDLIFAPLGTALAIRLIPRPILAECRVPSADYRRKKPSSMKRESADSQALRSSLSGYCWLYS